MIGILSGILAICISSPLIAELRGKADIGAAYVHIDVLQSGKTIKSLDMPGVKGDATVIVWKGLCLKPTVLYSRLNHSHLFCAGGGIGHYTPITKTITLTPTIGCVYTELETKLHLDFNVFRFRATEKFRSISPYLGLEGTWCFLPSWRVVAQFQYCWSHSDTTIKSSDSFIKDIGSSKDHAWGPSYAMMIERDINEKWSVHLGGAYNISLSKEKHGIRGYGCKLGIAYWF